ncbi:MAG: uracil-DNA glycosylase [Hyphomonas sp.]|nr:uracil-DNA glycosylase [Hyphomonas sp.]
MTDPDRKILAAVLEWSVAMGADTAVADEATNWLGEDGAGLTSHIQLPEAQSARSAAPPSPREAPRAAMPTGPRGPVGRVQPPKGAPVANTAAGVAARSAARSARDLDELRRLLETFEGCSLKATAKNLCFYRGASTAPVMIIGEAPGADEDIAGKPFVGRAGQLLDRMLSAAGWSEQDVHITNIVYWRPPGNRTPTPQEAEACRPFLERQIELVAPRVLLLLGGTAAKHILGSEEGILKIRGKWQELQIGALNVPVLASLHPAYLLRTPISKRQAWLDLLRVRERLSRELLAAQP